MKAVRLWASMLCVSAIWAALLGLLMWVESGWDVAWTSAARAFVVFSLVLLGGRSLRRYRWSGPGIWVAGVACGVVLAMGIPDRAHQSLGPAILIWATIDL